MICDYCQGTGIRRFSFTVSTGLKEHFNQAAGEYVSNRRQLDDAFKRRSEEMSARLGMDHEFVTVDPADMMDASAHGVDENTLEPTRKRMRDHPEDYLP